MKKKEIPALTLSGGTLHEKQKVLEFRVWVHPEIGDDFYYVYPSLKEAVKNSEKMRASGRYSLVETPLAVIWDKKMKDFREVVISKKKLKRVI